MPHLILASISGTRILLGSPLGFLIGLSLGALGGGGSILAVPVLVYVVGQGAKAATTTSLIVVGAASLIGMIGHYRGGRVRLKAGLAFGLAGLGGSFVGSELNKLVPGNVLLLAFAGLMCVVGWRMWSKGRADDAQVSSVASVPNAARVAAGAVPAVAGLGVSPAAAVAGASVTAPLATRVSSRGHAVGLDPTVESEFTYGDSVGDDVGSAFPNVPDFAPVPEPRRRGGANLRVLLVGTVVGFLTGFFGVGGGFVIVPGLVLALGYDMPVAVGTSLLVIVVSSIEGLAFRLSTASIDWGVALPFAAVSIVGVIVGNLVAGRVPAAKLNRWFVWLLAGLAIYTATESLIKLL
ncbi:sulfite exporter TauE/SafE family protein [Conexibacter sp. DBS9H8]|uniref:sulfite exporter TauE/SafE family protein n=1 Tax=Conexibacter sp. DBS9H8 TaxID=2937801 RepID=UPI00200BEFB3|nr:sulfite exporter TauE/SafE family protein [Conexibacter sp. DBS9H8]